MAKKLKQDIANMSIIMKIALVKAHHQIGMMKYDYGLLCQMYSIITIKILNIKSDLVL